MSPPAENARSPAPVSTITAIWSSASKSSIAWTSSAVSAALIALCFSGRFKVAMPTGPRRSTRTRGVEVAVIASSHVWRHGTPGGWPASGRSIWALDPDVDLLAEVWLQALEQLERRRFGALHRFLQDP